MFTSVLDWIAFRTTKRYNVVKIRTLEPNYWDKDTILLHAVMQLVVDYVEIELSALALYHSEFACAATLREKVYRHLPWFLRNDEWVRSRTRGLQQLAFEKTLNDDSVPEDQRCAEQARVAAEIEQIYLWWTEVYPNRLSPYDMPLKYDNDEKLSDDEILAEFDKCVELERQYLQEDVEMLKRVIDVRNHLWT